MLANIWNAVQKIGSYFLCSRKRQRPSDFDNENEPIKEQELTSHKFKRKKPDPNNEFFNSPPIMRMAKNNNVTIDTITLPSIKRNSIENMLLSNSHQNTEQKLDDNEPLVFQPQRFSAHLQNSTNSFNYDILSSGNGKMKSAIINITKPRKIEYMEEVKPFDLNNNEKMDEEIICTEIVMKNGKNNDFKSTVFFYYFKPNFRFDQQQQY